MTASVALGDLIGSVRRLPLAMTLALDDIHGKYRRTVLGPLWIVLGQVATIAGFVVVFSVLFNQDPGTYALYLAAGFPIWTLISYFLSDMPTTFIGAKGMIESYELPWLIHVWRRAFGYVLTFLHQIVPFFLVMAFLGVVPRPEMLYVIPALVVLILAGVGLGILLAIFGARYRDLQPAMAMAATFLFFFSPVMWRAEQLHINQWVVELNPLYYFIKLVRDPLLGVAPSADTWTGATAGALGVFLLGFVGFWLCRRRVYHWL